LTKSIFSFIYGAMISIEKSLKAHKLSVTAQRVAVMNAIRSHPHSNAEQVMKAVSDELGSISKQAVYDILHLFSEKKLIRSIQPMGCPTLYEHRVGDNHHHLICRKCLKTKDVDCATGATPCLTACNDHGYDIDEAEVIYWGICPDCKKSNEQK